MTGNSAFFQMSSSATNVENSSSVDWRYFGPAIVLLVGACFCVLGAKFFHDQNVISTTDSQHLLSRNQNVGSVNENLYTHGSETSLNHPIAEDLNPATNHLANASSGVSFKFYMLVFLTVISTIGAGILSAYGVPSNDAPSVTPPHVGRSFSFGS